MLQEDRELAELDREIEDLFSRSNFFFRYHAQPEKYRAAQRAKNKRHNAANRDRRREATRNYMMSYRHNAGDFRE